VEVSEFNSRTIKSLDKDGYLILKKGGSNPIDAVKQQFLPNHILIFPSVLMI